MALMLSLLAFLLAFIALAEGLMWVMYRKRTSSMRFPREADYSHIRLFTYGRMRYIIAIHTAAMMAICTATLLFLW